MSQGQGNLLLEQMQMHAAGAEHLAALAESVARLSLSGSELVEAEAAFNRIRAADDRLEEALSVAVAANSEALALSTTGEVFADSPVPYETAPEYRVPQLPGEAGCWES